MIIEMLNMSVCFNLRCVNLFFKKINNLYKYIFIILRFILISVKIIK